MRTRRPVSSRIWIYLTLAVFGALLASPFTAQAHVGSPNIFYEGKAAGQPVRIMIKPPGVIPGLADISVRVNGTGIKRVTVLPVYWKTGKKGSPNPDEAKLVRGETNLYTAALWLMKAGAYSVHVQVESASGTGELIVPVNSLATVRGEMPFWMGTVLACFGGLLFVGFISIIGSAATEATLMPGIEMTRRMRWKRIGWTAAAAVFAVSAVAGGRAWWRMEDREYTYLRLSKAWPTTARISVADDVPTLKLSFTVPDGQKQEWSPLVLDHGKWSHWFLVREPAQEVFAHVHPFKTGDRDFSAVVPPLPEGKYAVYADITHETGIYRTLVASLDLPKLPEAWSKRWQRAAANPNDPYCGVALGSDAPVTRRDLDPDDAWHIETSAPTSTSNESRLMNGMKLVWDRPAKLAANQDVSLQFRLVDSTGKPANVEPYLGMAGHLVIRRDDGSVFIHVHPVGNISMASQAILTARAAKPDAAREELFASSTSVMREAKTLTSEIGFPYAFPREGQYRLWVQFKHRGQVLTGTFVAGVDAVKE